MLGKEFAARLGLPFADLDVHIEATVGMPIPEIFEKRGELFFRKREHELLKELLESGESMVLSLGGGTPAYAGNMDLVTRATPHSFYLQHSIPSLVGRLEKERADRPLIFYTQAAHSIFCDGKSAEEILSEIEEKLA